MDNKVPNRKAGGDARAQSLTTAKRKEIARRAAAARWGLPQAKHDGELVLGSWRNIPCWVLDDERRIISQRSFMDVIEMPQKSSLSIGSRISQILDPKNLKSDSAEKLIYMVENPIRFLTTDQIITLGYEGEIIVEFCKAILYARRAGNLAGASLDYADQAERFLVNIAKTGIAALIDEATGYQEVRAKDALAKILEQYVAKDLQPWTKTFDEEFYREIFRLRKWPWPPLEKFKRPSVIGAWTNDFVYDRLAPGVLDELRSKNPKTPSGHRKHKHHQWLTGEIGHPKLRSHLDGVTRLLRGSRTWGEFKVFLDRFYKKVAKTELGFEVECSTRPPLEFDSLLPANPSLLEASGPWKDQPLPESS